MSEQPKKGLSKKQKIWGSAIGLVAVFGIIGALTDDEPVPEPVAEETQEPVEAPAEKPTDKKSAPETDSPEFSEVEDWWFNQNGSAVKNVMNAAEEYAAAIEGDNVTAAVNSCTALNNQAQGVWSSDTSLANTPAPSFAGDEVRDAYNAATANLSDVSAACISVLDEGVSTQVEPSYDAAMRLTNNLRYVYDNTWETVDY